VYHVYRNLTGGIDPLDWFPEEMNWSGYLDAPNGLSEKHRGFMRNFDGDRPFSQPPLQVAEI
jgi:hypothetical protein